MRHIHDLCALSHHHTYMAHHHTYMLHIGPDLGLVWCRFVLGLPTDNPVISFRLANRNRTDNKFLFFYFIFYFLSPRTEPVSLKSHSADFIFLFSPTNQLFLFYFLFFSPRTEPVSLKEPLCIIGSLSVWPTETDKLGYRFGWPNRGRALQTRPLASEKIGGTRYFTAVRKKSLKK